MKEVCPHELKRCPLKIDIPIKLEGSSVEDDTLQEIWARPLVNAADADSGVDVQGMFRSIVNDVKPLDATVLQMLYAVPEGDAAPE